MRADPRGGERHQRPARHGALPRARRRARAARQARLPAQLDRQVPDQAAGGPARTSHDRDFLAQIEAVDDFIANMHAYPGRTIGQLYHQLLPRQRAGRRRAGRSATTTIDLADVRVPVLSVAGTTDTLAPRAAVHHVARPAAQRAGGARSRPRPGGHLGVLTGRSAKRTTWRCLDEFFARAAGGRAALRVVASRRSPDRTASSALATLARHAPRPCRCSRLLAAASRRGAGPQPRRGTAPEPTIARGRQGRRRRPRADASPSAEAQLTAPCGAARPTSSLGAAGMPCTLTMADGEAEVRRARDRQARARRAAASAARRRRPSAGVDVPLVLSHSHLAVHGVRRAASRRRA